MKTLLTLGADFNKRHAWLLAAAKNSELALCGGCASAVLRGRTDYVPKDIDFVAKQDNAIAFLKLCTGFFLGRSVHFRIYGNSQNAFVPKTANAHFRITCGFWLPVCLFVLPDDQFRAYRIRKGHFIQFYTDIQKAAEELSERDEKPRIATEPLEDEEQITDSSQVGSDAAPEDLDLIAREPLHIFSEPTPIGSVRKE